MTTYHHTRRAPREVSDLLLLCVLCKSCFHISEYAYGPGFFLEPYPTVFPPVSNGFVGRAETNGLSKTMKKGRITITLPYNRYASEKLWALLLLFELQLDR